MQSVTNFEISFISPQGHRNLSNYSAVMVNRVEGNLFKQHHRMTSKSLWHLHPTLVRSKSLHFADDSANSMWCKWLKTLVSVTAFDKLYADFGPCNVFMTVDSVRLCISIAKLYCLVSARSKKFSYEGAVVSCFQTVFLVTWCHFALRKLQFIIYMIFPLTAKCVELSEELDKSLWLLTVW